LKKQATPQSSQFFDSKKRDSILFSVSGLEELTQLNPAFAQFESTLFDHGSKDFQRLVFLSDGRKKCRGVSIKYFSSTIFSY
jgi:hypothetical protein